MGINTLQNNVAIFNEVENAQSDGNSASVYIREKSHTCRE